MRTLVRLAITTTLFAACAFAQVDLAGAWQPAPNEDSQGNPELADYLGLPINDFARQWALSWDPDRLGAEEHQCQVHTASYIHGGPHRMRIWEERDPQTQNIIALHIYISTYEQNRVIWMDGRPHPPEFAAHTWMGFSTGKWEGNALSIHTTHIKQGWFRRNGVPSSDRVTLDDYFIRHGDQLTHVSVAKDPVYLSEPFVKSQMYNAAGNPEGNWLWPCEYINELPGKSRESVLSYEHGQNPYQTEFAARHNVPMEAALGGSETMYPEFRDKIKDLKPPPKPVPQTAGTR